MGDNRIGDGRQDKRESGPVPNYANCTPILASTRTACTTITYVTAIVGHTSASSANS